MAYYKDSFMRLLQEYEKLAKMNQEKLDGFLKSSDYTPEAKEKAKVAAKGQLAQYQQQYEKLLHGCLDNSITQVSTKISQRTSDPDYQLKMSNAFKMLELTGGSINNRELQMILEPFASDELAAKAFKGLMQKQGLDPMKVAGVFPEDKDNKTIEYLEKMKASVSEALSPEGPQNPFGGEFGGRDFAIQGIKMFIGGRTDNDMRYLGEGR